MTNNTYFTAANKWNNLAGIEKLKLAAELGWRTLKGKPDRTARKHAHQIWCELSKAAQRIYTPHLQ